MPIIAQRTSARRFENTFKLGDDSHQCEVRGVEELKKRVAESTKDCEQKAWR